MHFQNLLATMLLATSVSAASLNMCRKDFEEYRAGNSCDDTCDMYKCPIPASCKKQQIGCYCEKGMRRNDGGKCIPEAQCAPHFCFTPDPPKPPKLDLAGIAALLHLPPGH